MKVSLFLAAMIAGASIAQAQQPPTPPVSPVPPAAGTAPLPPLPTAAPTPAQAPAARGAGRASAQGSSLGGTRSLNGPDREYERYIDAQARSDAAMARSDAAIARASERSFNIAPMVDAELAMEKARAAMVNGQDIADKAMRAAQERINDGQFNFNFAPLARTMTSAFSSGVGDSYSYTSTTPPARWQEDWKQDREPADSLFNSGRDALNRGDWRRAADQFAQVFTKFPKSTRIASAAYYEAFARYRIGTTDDLKSGLRVLNERAQGSSNSTNANEVTVLATRIRGALAQRGDPEAARQLQADAQKGKNCDSEDMQVRSEALSALAQSDMAAATPMLRRVLDKKEPCNLELRRRALGILLRRADTAATSAAISVAKNADETIDLRTDAISYLSRLPGDNALAALEDLMRTSTDRDIQRAAIRSLSNTDNSKAHQAIRMLAERSDVGEQTRFEALSTFERDRGTNAEDAAFLRGLYPKLQSDALKREAIAAISKNPGTENEQFVLAIARNPAESSEIRGNAISRMYRIPAITIADIGKLYDSADSRSMRNAIISVLSQRKEPEAVDKLADIAKSSTDPNTRSQAISVLSRKDDPRAKKLLVDIAAGGTP